MTLNFEQLIQIIEEESLQNKVFVLGVCGLGGSGKTTLCRKLEKTFYARAAHLEMDLFAKYETSERRQRIQVALQGGDASQIEEEENPQNWYDWTTVSQTLSELKNRKSVFLEKAWNQKTGKKDLSITISLPQHDHPILIVDCIYLLHAPVSRWFDKIAYINTELETAKIRALARDSHRTDPEYQAYKETLILKYDIPYFQAFENNADIVLKA